MNRGQRFKLRMQPSAGRPPLRGSVDLVLALQERPDALPPTPKVAPAKALMPTELPSLAKAS